MKLIIKLNLEIDDLAGKEGGYSPAQIVKLLEKNLAGGELPPRPERGTLDDSRGYSVGTWETLPGRTNCNHKG